ncbi:MAG TPA: ATP synthase F1 subunit epsilon [Candidatus Acidoferrales bacterium]|nr:ATP synthase F1 subunit epsilon [Candidatus Acidoferrales bacterium]
MPPRFRLSLITPSAVRFEGEVEIVIAPGAAGDLGVLANHAPLLTTLRAGVVTAGSSDPAASDRVRFAVDRGFLQAMADRAIILTDTALQPSEVNAEDAKADLRRAEEAFAQKHGLDDAEERAAVAWARAKLELIARPV